VQVPAICDRCGTLFPSGFSLGPGAGATMVGNTAGPCPNCGGMGRIPDGTYQAAVSTTEFIRNAARNRSELQNLISVLETAQRDEYEPKRLMEAIEAQAPTFSRMGAFLPQSRLEFQNYLLILLGALAVLLAFLSLHPAEKAPSAIEIFNSIGQETSARPAQPHAMSDHTRVGRNDPCPCGSGKKYKKCHGVSTN
jgi:hypothetical protein